MTLSGATIVGQNGPGSNGSEGVPQSSGARASLSDSLMLYQVCHEAPLILNLHY